MSDQSQQTLWSGLAEHPTQAPLAGQTANPKGSVALPECLIFAVTRYLPSWASGSARVPLSPW